ncbi:MAG: hypothetical protein J6R19_05410, partial [Bacteroidales bacterium]|nr:hypothetical protein [Bacteroidales bacterium]
IPRRRLRARWAPESTESIRAIANSKKGIILCSLFCVILSFLSLQEGKIKHYPPIIKDLLEI